MRGRQRTSGFPLVLCLQLALACCAYVRSLFSDLKMFIPTQAKTAKTKMKTAPCRNPMTKAISQALTVATLTAVEVAPATPPAVFNTVAAKVATSTAQTTSSAIAHLRKVGIFAFVLLVESFV